MKHSLRLGKISWLMVGILSGCDGATPTALTASHPFTELIVFGDSLSDTGNVQGEYALIPQAPYYNGRFTNGSVWVEYVADHFGLTTNPAFDGGTNYAHGGSESGVGLASFENVPIGPNLRDQVQWYLDYHRPAGTELIVVWGGANDVFNILDYGIGKTVNEIADDVAIAVTVLYDRGGRSFFIPNLPDIGATPAYRGTDDETTARQLCADVNQALSDRLTELESLADITIYRLDVAALFNDTLANPPPEITNTTDSAWNGSYLGYIDGGDLVTDPDQYVFWDHVHPTRVVHQTLGDIAIGLIEDHLVIKEAAALPPDVRLFVPPPSAVFYGYLLSNLPPFFSN